MSRAVSRRVVSLGLAAVSTLILGLSSCEKAKSPSDAAAILPVPQTFPMGTFGTPGAISLNIGPRAPVPIGPSEELWNRTVDQAIAYLKSSQAADGSYSKELSLGVTGVVATGVLQTGRVTPDQSPAKEALKFLESLINSKEGHIAGENPRNQLKNYVTSVNVMAFHEADKALAAAGKEPRYTKVLADAGHYLKKLQWDDAEQIDPKDPRFGGVGYDSKDRPDLSNTQMTIEALKDLLPKDDPFFKQAQVFASRCQNFDSEHNTEPWAKLKPDGGFIYFPGESKAGGKGVEGDPFLSYGSMTYAGIKSLIYAGVDKNDPRVIAGFNWIRKHYTVERNPGMPERQNLDQQGLYYYYHTMAKCLDAMGVDYVEDERGVRHDWRREITAALAKRQRPDGSWNNADKDRWMEGDPNLVTGYALMALGYCKPKK